MFFAALLWDAAIKICVPQNLLGIIVDTGTTRRMKALVLKEYKRLVIEEVPEPTPAADEVLVAVRACGICGSDVHGMDGSTGRRRPPIIMGHEASGIVAGAGKGVTGWA